MAANRSEFRVVIFSSGNPAQIRRLIERIHGETPARVCGILSERRPPKPSLERLTTFVRNLRSPAFVRYAAGEVARAAARKLEAIGTALLHLLHAARPAPPPNVTFDDVARATGAALHVTTDYHDDASLAFVRGLAPHLGLVYGTRILKRALFAIPTHGSINIHKRKVPDYRGGGPIGLWEMLDGQPEIGVTVHEVSEKLDAGHVVNTATMAIEPFDTLISLALKAHVVGNDLLVRSVSEYAAGTVQPRTQLGTARMFKSPSPAELARYQRVLAGRPARYRVTRSRPLAKLVVKTALAAPAFAVRNWRRRWQRAYPVVVLFHHVVADRPHRMGISTEQFFKHVEYLRRHYRIVSLADAIAMLRAGRVDQPTVVLTFDDGYVDNFLTLRAIVEDTGVPLTLFVSTEHISSGREFAHDAQVGEHGFKPFTWEQLRQLHREGFRMGSHTRRHFRCGTADRARLEDEIIGSKRDLEERLGAPIELFSFPGGLPRDISPEAAALAAETYHYVLSAYGGSNAPAGDVKHLKRAFHASSLWDLELQIQGVLEREPAFTYAREPARPALRGPVLQAQAE